MKTELKSVERITEAEHKSLINARKEIKKTIKELERIESNIATSHGMFERKYLEWEEYYKFDGDYILLYNINHMSHEEK